MVLVATAGAQSTGAPEAARTLRAAPTAQCATSEHQESTQALLPGGEAQQQGGGRAGISCEGQRGLAPEAVSEHCLGHLHRQHMGRQPAHASHALQHFLPLRQRSWCRETEKHTLKRSRAGGFPGSLAVKNSPVSAGDVGSIPGPGRFHMSQST